MQVNVPLVKAHRAHGANTVYELLVVKLLCVKPLRHPKGGSFVRPAKASFGVDYLAAVRQLYVVDAEEVLSQEISFSSKKLYWSRIKERR